MKLGDFSRQCILVIAACIACGSQRAHGEPGHIVNLGTLGGSMSHAFSINSSGQIAGNSLLSDDFTTRAYRYSGTPGSGTMVALGTLGGTHSIGSAINSSGQVAGQSDTATNAAVHAFRYTGTPGVDGVMQDLGTLAEVAFPFGSSHAFAINDSGQVAGMSVGPTGTLHAFRYTGTPGIDGVMEDLGTLGGTFSQGYAINASGQVTGFSGTSGNAATHAFLYTSAPGGGIMTDLGTLGGSGSGGHAVNAAGHIAGNSTLAGDEIAHAFLYAGTPGSGGAMMDLGTLGGSYSTAWGINSFDQVVGESYTTGDAARLAFLYTGTPGFDGVMINLNAWLDATNPIEGAKWSLSEATGITDAGLITGNGYYDDGAGGLDDGFRAYILDASSLVVPEPSTIVLAIAAVLGLTGAAIVRRIRCVPNRR